MNMSSQAPHTPQRGRARYPNNLAKGGESRVPLHRRGTSKTYERLEDLLREAGYKETRVFTPEAERYEAEAEDRREREQREKERKASGANSGVSAVVSFFTGFIPGNVNADGSVQTQSLGRAAGKQVGNVVRLDEDAWAPVSPTPKMQQRKAFTATTPSTSNSTSPTSSGSTNQSFLRVPEDVQMHLPSPGRAPLRHMASAPNIPRRPNFTPRRPTNPDHLTPPLPSNWLYAVAKAVLGTGPNSGAYIGGPSHAELTAPRHPLSRRNSQLQGASRKPALSDRTNKLLPPHTHRAPTTPGAVTTTSVMCRSAPGSRSSSRVRGKDGSRHLPSLGASAVEGESWPSAPALPHRQLDAECESSDDEDGGELDLARLLVPAKRQRSIHSLRRHLHGTTRRPAPGARRAREEPGPDDSFEVTLEREIRRGRRGSADEGNEWPGLPGFDGASSKKRAPLPWWTQGRS